MIKKPIPGYITKYVNVGVYVQVTDRCCDGGTIINKKIPKTGDEANLALWIGCVVIGVAGITAGLVWKRKKARK
ncbi:MAG: LPXTG cell wall anchor domain-containing protein [Clostridia bacterium]|nr:LPXTG cell wall anchor domain-containing protein [Clostridia bacterium]